MLASRLSIGAVLATAATLSAQPQLLISVPMNFPTIGQAVQSVPPGGSATILVQPGVYNEEVVIDNRTIDLVGAGGAAQTTWSSAGLSPFASTLAIQNGSVVTMTGFTLRDGTGSLGGALRVSGATATLTGNVFTGNDGPLGGAIYCGGAGVTATIQGIAIFGNNAVSGYASNGGAVHIAAATSGAHNITISGNTINANQVRVVAGLGGNGGAIYVAGTGDQPVLISGNTFVRNVAGYAGGAIALFAANAQIVGNTISDGYAVSEGGGIYCVDSAPLIDSNTLSGNGWPQAGASLPTDYGGALSLTPATAGAPIVRANLMSNNIAGVGGAIHSYGSNAQFLGNNVSDNGGTFQGQTWPVDGGGIYIEGGAPRLQDNTLCGNHARWSGGGITCISGSAFAIVQNVIGNNLVDDGNGGGMLLYGVGVASPAIVQGNTIAMNKALKPSAPGGLGKGGSVYVGNISSLDLWNCICWGSTARNEVDGIPVNLFYCVIPSTSGGSWSDPQATCVFTNPRFVDATVCDFHLKASSLARDKGSPATSPATTPPGGLLPFDRDGNPRVVNGRVDIGAYEYQ